MIQKLKAAILSSISIFMFALPVATPVAVYAQDIEANLCSGAQNLKLDRATGECVTIIEDDPTGTFNDVLARIVNIISVIVGVVAVIMIIVGGFRYVTSGGTSEKVTSAKNTILYGIIGLIIVALAQVIVRFVLRETTSAT